MNNSLTWQMEQTGDRLSRDQYAPKSKHGNGLRPEARKHLPNSLLKTASLQGTIPTHSDNTSCSATPQTAACADFSGFQIYGLLFSYIPHILPQCWVIKCNLSNLLLSKLCNYWRTEFLWVPTSWLARKYSVMRYQFSISFWGEKTQKKT